MCRYINLIGLLSSWYRALITLLIKLDACGATQVAAAAVLAPKVARLYLHSCALVIFAEVHLVFSMRLQWWRGISST